MNSIWLNAVRASGAIPWYLAGGAPMPVAAYQPIGAASLAASYTNLASPGTFDAAPGVAPSWSSANGWHLNAVLVQWLKVEGFLLPNNQTITAIARFSDTAITGRGNLFGFNTEFAIQPYFDGTNKLYRSRASSQQFYPPIATVGVVATAGLSNYLDGSLLGLHTVQPVGTDFVNMAIGSQSATAPGNHFQGNIQAIAIYDTTLTAPQVAAVSAAMAAL